MKIGRSSPRVRGALAIAADAALAATLCGCAVGDGPPVAPPGEGLVLPDSPAEPAPAEPAPTAPIASRTYVERRHAWGWLPGGPPLGWADERAEARAHCHQELPASQDGFFTGVLRDQKAELICFTVARRVTATWKQLEVAGVPLQNPGGLRTLGWADANRLAQSICRSTLADATAGLFDGAVVRGGCSLVCLGPEVQLYSVGEGFSDDVKKAAGNATALCRAHAGAAGFFTGAPGSAPGTHELACLAVNP